MLRPIAAAVIHAILAGASLTHGSVATIQIVHDDPDGVVAPGQLVHITAQLQWEQGQYLSFAASGGSCIASPALGTAHNPFTPLSWAGTTAGTPAPGGIADFRLTGIPPLFTPVWYLLPNAWHATPLPAMSFDWIAPATPGEFEFDYTPSAEFPLVELYASESSEFGTPVSTAYIGTNLTVIPTPSVVAFLVLGVTAAPRSRRDL